MTVHTKARRHDQPVLRREDFVSCEGAGRLTGFSRQTWKNWARKGLVTYIRLGSRILIPRSEISRLIADGTRPAVEQAVSK